MEKNIPYTLEKRKSMDKTKQKPEPIYTMWEGLFQPEQPFETVIGGTRYEVSCHFDPEGNKCVWEQFRDLIMSQERE